MSDDKANMLLTHPQHTLQIQNIKHVVICDYPEGKEEENGEDMVARPATPSCYIATPSDLQATMFF